MDGPRDYHTKWSESERERQIPDDITYMWNLRHKGTYLRNRNRLMDIENRLVVAKGEGEWGRDGLGVWDQQMQTIIHRMDKQQGPTVEHRELYSVPCDKPSWKRIWKRTCIYIKSLCSKRKNNDQSSPEFSVLFNMVATSHVWLFQLKWIKMKYNPKCSVTIAPATFQGLSEHPGQETAILYDTYLCRPSPSPCKGLLQKAQNTPSTPWSYF